jgi:hypothetical protein
MYFALFRFEGERAQLAAAYDRLMQAFPLSQVSLQACVERPGGLDVYDACPSQEAFESFSASADFRNALQAAGLPAPQIVPLGPVNAAFAQGARVA